MYLHPSSCCLHQKEKRSGNFKSNSHTERERERYLVNNCIVDKNQNYAVCAINVMNLVVLVLVGFLFFPFFILGGQ